MTMTDSNHAVPAGSERAIQVAAFAGSLRRHSFNRGLIRAAAELAPPGMHVNIVSIDDLPLFNADIDGPNGPQAVRDFQRRIAEADALLIATPEYNYSISGVLKNAIDWASRKVGDAGPSLQGKPAAIMGAGGRFGTVRAQAHLRYILLHNDVKLLNKPELMIPRAWDAFDQEANLTESSVRDQLREFIEAFHAWAMLLVSASHTIKS